MRVEWMSSDHNLRTGRHCWRSSQAPPSSRHIKSRISGVIDTEFDGAYSTKCVAGSNFVVIPRENVHGIPGRDNHRITMYRRA